MDLLYVGKFKPWTDKNEQDVLDALKKFDKVYVCVQLDRGKTKATQKQPTKTFTDDVEIIYFKTLKKLLDDMSHCPYFRIARG